MAVGNGAAADDDDLSDDGTISIVRQDNANSYFRWQS